jgi:hypothetical protein
MNRSRAHPVRLAAALLALFVAAAPRALRAQAGLGHLDDATVVPAGRLRLDVTTAWTRFNARFAPGDSANPTIPLGADYSFDSLGVAELPALSGTQSAIGTLTGSPFKLSLGSTQAAADARIVVTPISAAYGLTKRITIGAMIPLVRTRTSIQLRVNPLGTEGNVGINPASVNLSAVARDSAVVAQLVSASASLQSELQACQANPGASPNCGTILAQQAQVTSLIQSATSFAATFGAVYGENAQIRGAPVVPVTGSAADVAIRGRLTTFDSSFQAYLNSGALITATPAAAGGVMGTDDLGTFLHDPGIAGFDSLKSTIKLSTGDLELSARVQLFDRFADSATATRPGAFLGRATFTGTVSFPTGQRAFTTNPLDIGAGRGTMAVGGRLATYLQRGHIGLSAAGEYTKPLGKTSSGAFPLTAGDLPFPPSTSDAYPYTPGAITRFEVAPRLVITHQFGLSATYDYLNVGPNDYGFSSNVVDGMTVGGQVAVLDGVAVTPGTEQAAGFGITYSTVPDYDRGKAAFPIDVTFTHQETLTGAPRMPKAYRDQIQIRVYLRKGR